MKKYLLILLILSALTGSAQYSIREIIGTDTLCSKDSSPDSLFWKHSNTYTFYFKTEVKRFIPYNAISAKPTTLAGYGISDAATSANLSSYSLTSHTHAYSEITGKPTISGTNTGDQDLSGYSLTSHTHTFASNTSKPTTLSGYGITDGVANTVTVNGHALSSNVTVTAADLSLGNVTNTSDANKPVSTAQQTALDLKLTDPTAGSAGYRFLLGRNDGSRIYATRTVNNYDLAGGNITLVASDVGLGNVTNESKATMHTNATFTGTFTAPAGSIASAALANAAVANLSGTNTGDNSANSTYANDYRAANFVAGTNYLAPNGSAASLTSFPTLNQNTSGTAAGLSAVLSYANGGISAAAATSATTGTMTVNMTSSVVTITPTGSCTFNASGGVAGQILVFSITTSGVSSFTLTWGTNFRKTGTLATGTTSARFFTVTFICLDGTTWTEIARTAVQS